MTKQFIAFCPVPYCKGIMQEKEEASSVNGEEKKVWICPACHFRYKGNKPMDIWEEVARTATDSEKE